MKERKKYMSFNSRDFKGFTFRSGPVKKEKKSFSTFWDTNSNDVDVDDFLSFLTGPLLKVNPLKSLLLKLIYFFLSFI